MNKNFMLLTTTLILATSLSALAADKKDLRTMMAEVSANTRPNLFVPHPNDRNRKIEVSSSYAELLRQQGIDAKKVENIPRLDIKVLTKKEGQNEMGPSVGGGSFSDSRGAIVYIKKAITNLKQNFALMSQVEFDNLQIDLDEKYPSKQALLEALDHVKVGYNEQTWVMGPNGYAEQLMADYRITPKGSYIVLQRRLLDTYTAEGNETAVDGISRIILHEISHLFKVGVKSNSDNKSLALSERFAKFASNKVTTSYDALNNKVFIVPSRILPYFAKDTVAEVHMNLFARELKGQTNQLEISFQAFNNDGTSVRDLSNGVYPMRGLSAEDLASRICNTMSARKINGFTNWKVEGQPDLRYNSYSSVCVAND